MKYNKVKKIFLMVLFLIIVIFPKINIIEISGSRTGIRLDDVALAVYFILFIRNIIKNKFNDYGKLRNIIKIFCICMISFLISNIFGIINHRVSIVLSFLHLARKIEYFLMIFAGIDLYNLTKDKKIIIKLIKFSVIFHGIYCFFEYFNLIPDIGQFIGRMGNNRIYSTFSGPYEFAGYLILILPIIYNEYFLTRKKTNLIYIFLILIAVLLSESRISLAAAMVILAYMYYKNKIKNKKVVLILTPILLLIIVPFLLINPLKIKQLNRFSSTDLSSTFETTKIAWKTANFDFYKENGYIRYNKYVLNSTTDVSFALRISKWTTLIKENLKSPIFGMGLSIAGEAMDGSFTRLFCECGIIGLILWLYLLKNISKCFKKTEHYLIVNMLILSIAIGSMFIDIFEASKVMMPFWFIIGFYAIEEKPKKKIKVAHIVSGFNFGGVESVLYNYYKNIDATKFENIVISHSKVNEDNASMFDKFNFKFFEVTPKRKNIFKNFMQLYIILKKENPDIVHVHMSESSAIALFCAYINGIKIRICHAHTNNILISLNKKIEKALCNMVANKYFACSDVAAKNLFFKKNYKNTFILKNAFCLDKFDYNIKKRKNLRKKYNINNDDIVIGHVGRLSHQKNHKKLIEIYDLLIKENKNYKLLFIGNGELKEQIKSLVKKYKDNVIMINCTSKVEDYYQVMDVFVFPSYTEGLGIAVIEAQVSGLKCIVSDKVPKDVKQTDLVEFLDLNLDNKIWKNKIIEKSIYERKSYLNKMRRTDYNISKVSNLLEKKYYELFENR